MQGAAFRAILALLVLVGIELLAYLAIAIVERAPTGLAVLHERQDALAHTRIPTRLERDVRNRASLRDEIVHPYLGFIPAPNADRDTAFLFDGEPRPPRRSPEQFWVGIAGGSVAASFVEFADSVLVDRLRASPALAGRDVKVVSLAHGGWKQPQQLMALSYLLASGGQLDVLINLDGFNEVALHGAENGASGVFPAYPRNWTMRVRPVPDAALLPAVGRYAQLEATRRRWARELGRAPFRWSATAGFIWLARDRMLGAAMFETQRQLLRDSPDEADYAWTGPQIPFESENALAEELVSIWSRSSAQMHRLCRENGIHYLHLLQPNQYVPGSKPMDREERRLAVKDDQPYRFGAERGYPSLVRECRRLAQRGVPCHDLTRIFAEVREPVYIDSCCHFGQRGYELVGEYVAGVLLDALE